jgi:hypothetical protein
VDVRALAARTRSVTGSAPIQAPSAAELSGVHARRDSVVGARMTPPPTTSNAQLPNLFWGVLGCLSTLVVGFAALWGLASSGRLPGMSGAVTPSLVALRAGSTGVLDRGRIQVEQIAPVAPAGVVPVSAHSEARRAPARERPAGVAAAAVPHSPKPAPSPAAPKPAAATEDDESESPAKPAAPPPGRRAAREAVVAAEPSDQPAARETAPAEPAVRAPAVLREISGDEDEERHEALPRDVVEAALKALTPKVRRCFIKFQIPGNAQVRVVATPAGGPADSVNVSGDFEGTPTGDCVEAEVAAASLPQFKGGPVRLNHTYQLR